MGFSGKTDNKKTAGSMKTTTTKHRGDAAEDAALDHLQATPAWRWSRAIIERRAAGAARST
jgi:hypothetical protein